MMDVCKFEMERGELGVGIGVWILIRAGGGGLVPDWHWVWI